MNWFKYFRLLGNKKKAPISKAAPRHRLRLEELEVREVPAAPFVVSTTPATGGLLGAPPLNAPQRIEVLFSEDVTGATNKNNFLMFASDGTPVNIGAVTYNAGTFTTTILASNLTVNGGALPAGVYSLFLRGDQIVDVDENLPLARPGELVVANAGRNSLSTVALNGTGLGAVSTISLPIEGTNNYLPSGVATGDLNADGITDLVVTSSGQNTLNVHLGNGNGFSTSPDLTIGLSASPSGVLIAELNGDAANAGKNEIVLVNSAAGTVTVFVNQNTAPGSLAFDSGTSYSVGSTPSGIVAGLFNDDTNVDLAVSNAGADGSNNYTANIITGKGDGTFNATTSFIVGTTGPTGTVAPTGIAVGRFNGDTQDDLVVSGTTFLSVLTNTSAGANFTFGVSTIDITGFTASSVATGSLTTGTGIPGNGKGTQDIVATRTDGNVISFVNDGTGAFDAAPNFSAGVASPIGLQMRDLTGDMRQELVYVNGAAAGGAVSRAPLFRSVVNVADAQGDGTNPIEITATGHGLSTGNFVILRGINNFAAANGGFTITVTGADTFTLDGTDGITGDANNNTGSVFFASPQVIQNAVKGAAGAPTLNRIVITSANHGLRSGQQITITGATGTTVINNTFYITRLSADTFALNGTENTAIGGTYNANTASWALPVYATGATPTGLALADFTGDGIRDLVTANKTDNTTGSLSYYTGSGTSGTGDGTFLSATNLALASAGVPRATAVGDLNGDGIPDLVATDSKNNVINIFLGLAGGGYGAPTSKSLTTGGNSRNPVSVAIGDVNNDNKLDVVVASNQDNVVALFTGNGNGTVNNQTRISVGSGPTQVVLADVNDDGDLDLVVAHNGKSRGVSLRLGNGNATFQNTTEIFGGKSTPRASGVAVGDFNRDGALDIVVTDDVTNGTGTVRVALGSGNGSFPSGNITTITVGTNPTAVEVADFNSDGFVDIATVSRSNSTTENISVLLNNVGTGFQSAIHTQLTTDPIVNGSVLHRLKAVNVNSDAFIDLVVTAGIIDAVNNTTNKNGADGVPDKDTPNPVNNTFVLYGTGDGSFTATVAEYTVAGPNATSPPPVPFPSAVEVISDPFRLLSTFNVGGTTVSANLLRNGSFENRALTGEQGNLDGWNVFRLTDTTRGSAGQFLAQTGASSPLSLSTVPPPANGRFRAMLDQQHLQPFSGNNNPNDDASYAGSHALYQDVTIPGNVTSARLSFSLYLNSDDAFTDIGPSGTVNPDDALLDYRTTDPNQQVRVDIMSINNNILGLGTNVRQNLFKTQTNTTTNGTLTFTGNNSFDLSAFAGQTIRVRFAATNNQGKLMVGVDDARVQVVFTDNTAPVIQTLNLRNPTFLSSANNTPQSTDPTLVGRITDNGSINNVSKLTFDLGNNGFGGADDVTITTFDANGYFTFTPTTLLPGFQTIPVRAFDQAGNFVQQTTTFILQGPSLTNWQAAGPGPIDISGAGLNYSTVSGKITGVAVDPSDPSGNTFYISSSNGGVWKTVDGGEDWLALTDNVRDATGERINVSAGGLALGINPSTNGKVIYAATGVDDNAFTSRSSVGVLQSLDDGRTWRVIGGATRNASGAILPGIFTGARVSKIVVDPSNPAIVYVAVTSWDVTTKAPMILKTTNGLAANPTWTNVLNPNNMFVANRTDTLTSLSQGLASVTDLIVDPFNPGRVIVGLGNIGQFISGEGAGVWKSIDGGATWDRVEGGDSLALASATYDGTLPFGATVGRVTLAQGNGRVGDERFVYVMMAEAVATTNQFAQGGYMGLYKSKDNMLNFTKVMLRQPGAGHARFTEVYEDIELLGNEGGNVGALVVDPSNPNVVYVGGSRRFTDPGDPPQHAFIRVDTGNMRDTDYVDLVDGLTNDGDDRDKAGGAAAAGGTYPTGTDSSGNTVGGVAYDGEGVYWYDIEQSRASDSSTRRRLPPSIHRLAFDPQGRLIIGTENGLFRGVPLGFGYDFRSSFAGILAGGGGGGGQAFNPPGMTITDLNNNLQITDLTSVAIDPTDRSRFYVSAAGVGSGLTPGGLTAWQTMGLTGPNTALGNLGIPNSFQVLAANLAPDAPVDAVTTLYRTWQFDGAGSLIPEVSADAGGSFDTTGSAGISSQDTSNLAPVLAINSVKAEVNGQFFDELLFGTNKVYLTRTGGNVWDAISGNLGAGFISALAFSPSQGEYLAGTDEAKVFIKSATGNNFVEITNNLATLIGLTLTIRINGITVDPNDRNVVYVMAATANGKPSVFRGTLTRNSTQAVTGASWAAVTGGLPLAASYKMIIDRRASNGAPNGRFYVGTDRGVFTSTDGSSWTPLGAGLPAAPVVDLQFNPTFEILAAATQGRGVFTISTARSGPAIVNVTPATPVDNGPLTQVNVTFNTPVDPRTFNADQNNIARTVLSLIALTTTDVADVRVRELIQQYQRRVANAGDVSAARPTFFFQDASGNIEQVPDAALAGGSINRTRDDGELRYTAQLVAADTYVTTVSNALTIDGAIPAGEHTNRKWLESVWLDLLGRTSGLTTLTTGDDDAAAVTFLAQLQGSPGQATRFGIALQLTGVNRVNNADPNSAYATINPLSKEFHTNLVASLFNKFLGRNYPAVGAVSTEIDAQVATLQRRGLLRNVNARIISTTEAYSKIGNDRGLPTGTEATAVAFGNFTGQTVSADTGVGATRTNVPVLDMAVATNGNRVLVYQGKVGGGYATTPTLNLALPGGANPADLLVADLNGDGMDDLAVANSGLGSSGDNSLSVFFNNRAAVGQLSFAARTDLDGGENPIAVKAADYDGDAIFDLITTGRTTVSNDYNVNVLLGTGSGNFAASPTLVKIGDTNPTGGELSAPTGLAVANVNANARPDLILSGDNGVTVFNNTSTPGNLSGALLANRLTNTPTTSIAVGNLDVDDTDNDIVATSDAAAGELLIFRNDGGAFPVGGQFTTPAGTTPRAVQLADMNGDGKLDAVVVNKALVGGAFTVLYNTTVDAPSAPDTIAFQTPFAYPVTGTLPSVLALGDTNQDGVVDAAFGYEGSEFVSQYVGAQQGLMKVASDRNWLDWIFRSQANRPFTQAERDSFVLVLAKNALAFLNGSDGVYAPLSITPTDSTNMTYTLTFAPRLFDSTYRLFIGPNGQGINLKDFIDLNGTYQNTGNPMNQDRDATNGETPTGSFPNNATPGDRFSTTLAVNNSDTGRFLSALFEDFRGTGAGGREPDNATFISLFGTVEAQRLSALTNIANGLVGSTEMVNLLVEQTFQRYLRRAAGGDLAANSTAIQNGTLTVRQLVANLLASNEYFTNAVYGGNSDNQTWANAIYRDVVPGTTAPTYAGTPARATFATNLVLSDAAVQRTISEYFLRVLGRTPNRTANDPRLDETTTYSAEVFSGTLFNFTTLLKSGPASGQLSGDQRLIVALVGSQEYLRLNGNSNFEWLRSLYNEVLGRALSTPIDVVTPGGEFDLKLNQLLNVGGYTTARQSNLNAIIYNLETRERFYRDYYTFFIGLAPSAAQLTAFEAVYQANGQRLERVIADIVRAANFDPLSGPGASNSNWLEKVYQALLGRGTNGDATSQAQLTFLNNNTTANEATLSAARNTVALQILSTTEYRQRLLNNASNPQGFFNKYLNRPASGAEVNTFVAQLAVGARQEDVLIAMLRGPEYYRLQ
jgi:hypothetical protein